jgi:hypothetical protein
MAETPEGSINPQEQLDHFKKRISFLKDSLTLASKQLRQKNTWTADIQEKYEALLAMLDLDEELLEPEFVDALNDILDDRRKQIQSFIDSVKQ